MRQERSKWKTALYDSLVPANRIGSSACLIAVFQALALARS